MRRCSGPSLAVAGTYFAGAEARRALGWATACMAGSAIVGVPVLTAVATLTGWRLAFIAAGGAVIGAVLLGAAWLPRDARVPEGRLRSETLLAAYRPLLRHRPTLRLYGVAVLRAICWFGLLTYFGAFLAEELALSTGLVGLAYMLGGSGYFLGSVLSGGPLGVVPPRTLLVAGNVAMALLMGLAFSAILGPIGTVAMLPLAGFAGAFGWVAVAALADGRQPGRRGDDDDAARLVVQPRSRGGRGHRRVAAGSCRLRCAGHRLADLRPGFGAAGLVAGAPGDPEPGRAYRTGLKSLPAQ